MIVYKKIEKFSYPQHALLYNTSMILYIKKHVFIQIILINIYYVNFIDIFYVILNDIC